MNTQTSNWKNWYVFDIFRLLSIFSFSISFAVFLHFFCILSAVFMHFICSLEHFWQNLCIFLVYMLCTGHLMTENSLETAHMYFVDLIDKTNLHFCFQDVSVLTFFHSLAYIMNDLKCWACRYRLVRLGNKQIINNSRFLIRRTTHFNLLSILKHKVYICWVPRKCLCATTLPEIMGTKLKLTIE